MQDFKEKVQHLAKLLMDETQAWSDLAEALPDPEQKRQANRVADVLYSASEAVELSGSTGRKKRRRDE